MIFISYQGIGKSTLCNNQSISFKFIDLESSSFFNDEGVRPDDWYIYYCNIAERLSAQHCTVFVSSHKVVRDRLKKSKERVCVICPSIKLKDQWIERLENRYNSTKLEKDYKAWQNAVDRYTENIEELKNSGIPVIEIDDMKYDLKQLVIKYEIELLAHKITEENE